MFAQRSRPFRGAAPQSFPESSGSRWAFGMFGTEGVDHVRSEPLPRVRRTVACRGHNPGVGEQEHGNVRGDEVRAQLSLSLRSSDELFQILQSSVPELLGRGRGREPHRYEVLEPGVSGLHRTDPVDEPAKACPRVRIVERAFGSSSVVGHLSLEAGCDEVGPGGESSVEGADTHAGSPRDLLQGGVQAPLGKYLLGCSNYPLPIAFGVSPQARRARSAGRDGRSWASGRTASLRRLDHYSSVMTTGG